VTKEEAIDKGFALLELVEALPDGVDIMIIEANEFRVIDSLEIHLNSGIEAVAKSLGRPIHSSTSEDSEYIHRRIHANNCEYVQLDKAAKKEAAPGDCSTEDGRAAPAAT